MLKVFFIFLLIGGFGLSAVAQSPYTAEERFSREGRYVKVTLLMGNPIKIFVSGKERARVDLTDLKMEIRPAVGEDWQELKINSYGEYYTAEAPGVQTPGRVMEVKTTLKNKKSDSFKFKLK